MNKKRVDVAIAIILDPPHQKVLICQRRNESVLGGLWEFPGGKRHADETLEQCAQREVMEELGIMVQCLHPLDPIEHDYPHALVRLYPFICEHVSGEPQLLAVQAVRWINPAEILSYEFPPANHPLLLLIAQGSAVLLQYSSDA